MKPQQPLGNKTLHVHRLPEGHLIDYQNFLIFSLIGVVDLRLRSTLNHISTAINRLGNLGCTSITTSLSSVVIVKMVSLSWACRYGYDNQFRLEKEHGDRPMEKVWWHSSKGIVIKGSEYTNQSLKPKDCHIDNLLVTGCTRGCQSDNLRCNQWRKGCQYDLLFSVVWQDLILHLKIKTRSHRSQWDN